MLFGEVARTSRAVAATSARREKVRLIAECLSQAQETVGITVFYLSGELPQRQIGVGWASLREPPAPATTETLTVAGVDAALTEIGSVSGKGSVARRKELVGDLLGRATAGEQEFLIRLLSGELRQGALDGVMAEAIASAAGVPATEVRRAVMLRGALGPVASAAIAEGVDGLRSFGLEPGRPLRPMLAQSAASAEAAAEKLGIAETKPAAAEWKMDGIRVQAHILGGSGGRPPGDRQVRLFTRTLDDITARAPEVVAVLRDLPVREAVLDGELIALRPDGRPHPFQVTSARVASQGSSSPQLSVFLFDVLHADGEDLIDEPGERRYAALAKIVPEDLLMPRIITGSADEAAEFFAASVARGHEGLVIKTLDTPYTAGRRGGGWVKVKPRHTLDLLVIAAEWGHGRRRGWLSNLHLAARGPDGPVMLGKTFKGLTDELLTWQTEKLLALEERRDSYTVYVRPELVVEIAFDGIQNSTRYPGGIALRFARVLRYRPDKPASEADTIETVHAVAPEH